MSDPYLGQIEAFAFGYAPVNWVICAGQTLPINQYQALFSLLGTSFGGNGTTTFQLPDLRSRVVVGQGNGAGLTPRVVGEVGGEVNHTLQSTETPLHGHTLNVAANAAIAGNVDTPGITVLPAQTTGKTKAGTTFAVSLYTTDANPSVPMAPAAVVISGGQPHPNLMPYLTINYCISMSGIYPTRN